MYHRNVVKHEKCIKDYSQDCLETFPRQATGVFIYGVAKTNKGYCGSRRRKDKFISLGKCGNTVKSIANKCMDNYIDTLLGIENARENKLKIPMMCW